MSKGISWSLDPASGNNKLDFPNGYYSYGPFFWCQWCDHPHKIEEGSLVRECTTLGICWKVAGVKFKLQLVRVNNNRVVVEELSTGQDGEE